MSCFAQGESESIRKTYHWGVRHSFKNGNVPMQYARLLGYKEGVDGLPEILPEETEIIREFFRRYIYGASVEQTALRSSLEPSPTKLSRAFLCNFTKRLWVISHNQETTCRRFFALTCYQIDFWGFEASEKNFAVEFMPYESRTSLPRGYDHAERTCGAIDAELQTWMWLQLGTAR